MAALKGRPGIFSARYAGPESSPAECLEKVLLEMTGRENRACRFVAVLALARRGVLLRTFRGVVDGLLTTEARGSRGFGYDPVFFYPQAGRTFAEMSPAEKNEVSHRSRALQSFLRYVDRDHPW